MLTGGEPAILWETATGKEIRRFEGNMESVAFSPLDRLKDRTGVHVLAGCAADAVSYEATRYGQGLLTYSLLLGMRRQAARRRVCGCRRPV